jgi:hypothetical protein
MYKNLYSLCEERVKRLADICDVEHNGPLARVLADVMDILENCPGQHAEHYVKQFFQCAAFCHEEAWMLMNSQLVHPYQKVAYRNFIYPDKTVKCFMDGTSMSSRWISSCKDLSVLSYDGIRFLNDQCIQVI